MKLVSVTKKEERIAYAVLLRIILLIASSITILVIGLALWTLAIHMNG